MLKIGIVLLMQLGLVVGRRAGVKQSLSADLGTEQSEYLSASFKLKGPCNGLGDCCACAQHSYPYFDDSGGQNGGQCESCGAWIQKYVIPTERNLCRQPKPCTHKIQLGMPFNFVPMSHTDAKPWNPLTAAWVFAESPHRNLTTRHRPKSIAEQSVDTVLPGGRNRRGAELGARYPEWFELKRFVYNA